MIDVTFCVHDTGEYLKHTATAIVSILENTKADVTIHLIHDSTVKEMSIWKLKQMVFSYHQQIRFYEINEEYFKNLADEIKSSAKVRSFSIGTLFRLKLAEILSLDKVLYLDSDIVVNMDLAKLWKIKLDSHYLAAVLDLKDTRHKITNRLHFSKMNISYSRYFNAGVILFNLKIIRNKIDMLRESVEFLKKNSKDAIFFDQDALNYLFQGECMLLESRYNFMPVALPERKVPSDLKAIIHFAGPKPWKYICSQFDYLYWFYLSKTPWGNSIDNLLSLQRNLRIDLGYSLFSGKIGSRRMLVKGILYRALHWSY